MVQLSVSVGLANVILWLVIEVFLLLITNTATSLIARYSVNNRLLSKETLQLNGPNDLIDRIPYNSDLFLAKRRLKLPLTLCRIIIIAVSIYIGANLGGERELADEPLAASSAIFLAPEPGLLTDNSGEDINAMSKLSCLRIIDNNRVVLYKGYASPLEDVVCEDGEATATANVLLRAEIRASFRTAKTGRDMRGLNLFDSRFENQAAERGMQLSSTALIVNATDESGGLSNVAFRIIFVEELSNDLCLFGIWRSPGVGFERRVDLKLEAPCTLQIAALDRMLRPKPEFLPPRMAFFYQVVDSVVVERRESTGPKVHEENIVAALPVSTIVVTAVISVISTMVGILFGIMVRRGKVRADIADARGVGEVLSGPSGDKVLFRWDEDAGRIVWVIDGAPKGISGAGGGGGA